MSSCEPRRDFVGYGKTPPHAEWPGGARIALNINLNFEAGGERSVLEGDTTSESLLTDTGFPPVAGARSPLVESAFEYGSRCGVWRLLRIFDDFAVKASVLAVAKALEANQEAAHAFVEAGHEIVSHGYRWIDYQGVPETVEREHVRRAVDTIAAITGVPPVGWMTGRPSPNTRRLLVSAGIIYDRDALNDELPYWTRVEGRQHLVIPYSYETNDNRFDEHRGFKTADDFFQYLRDAFDVLYAEGVDRPKMMSIGLHDRLTGRPARAGGLVRFLDHVSKHDRVWVCRGVDIARHWIKRYPPPDAA
jgi:allantoinase